MITKRRNLKTGRTIWQHFTPVVRRSSDGLDGTVSDVIIVGGGISGALVADRVSKSGRRVVLLDRRPPGDGSTAASTALIQWEVDLPLRELKQKCQSALNTGPVPGQPNVFAVLGAGGNGITYSALASHMASAWIEGNPHKLSALFALR